MVQGFKEKNTTKDKKGKAAKNRYGRHFLCQYISLKFSVHFLVTLFPLKALLPVMNWGFFFMETTSHCSFITAPLLFRRAAK